jgi:hypothetical protein
MGIAILEVETRGQSWQYEMQRVSHDYATGFVSRLASMCTPLIPSSTGELVINYDIVPLHHAIANIPCPETQVWFLVAMEKELRKQACLVK